MKTIMLGLTPGSRPDATLDYVIELARHFDSHIIGLYAIPSSLFFPATGMEVGLVFTDDTMQTFYRKKMDAVKEAFETRMARSGLSFEFKEKELFDTDIAAGIAREARTCDLLVLSGPPPIKKITPQAMETVRFLAETILAAGRPVLVVPQHKGLRFKLGRVAVAWNGSREASRAAFDALPILKAAEDVMLAWVNPDDQSGNRLPGTDLAETLASHDVKVTVKGLRDRRKIGGSLNHLVEEHDVDLLVMGAYGRSRLRERILGGATEAVLRDLPSLVLLSN